MPSVRSSVSADTTLRTGMQDVSRLLSRLQQQLLAPSPFDAPDGKTISTNLEAELRTSVYLRRKIAANVEYARALLLRLERDVAAVKVQSQRTAWAAELRAHREVIARLNKRLIELDQADSSDDDASDDDNGTAPVITTAQHQQSSSPLLRSRAGAPEQRSDVTATGLFSARPQPQSSLQTREALMTSQSAEQELIKSSLVDLASALRASNVDFGRALGEEKAVLDRAAQGLDRNALGLESAERKMGTLRKMTEGQGLYGRIKLYAIIAALWVAAFLLVFVGPKLRF